MLAFRKALHPEFFGIESRNRVEHADYETEAWIFRGGHSLRFQLNGFCLTEVVVEHIDQIPDRGLIAALPCAGERDFEEKVASLQKKNLWMRFSALPSSAGPGKRSWWQAAFLNVTRVI